MSVFTKKELIDGMIDCTAINNGYYDVSLSYGGNGFFVVKTYENNDLVYKMKHDSYTRAKADYVKTIKELESI